MRFHRHRLFAAGAAVALLLTGLRLSPGQALLARGLEAFLAQRLQAEVRIDRLRSNLWDLIVLEGLRIGPRSGGVAAVSVERLRVRSASGPPFGAGLERVDVEGVEVTLRDVPDTAGTTADAAVETAGEPADLRRWIPRNLRLAGVTLEGAATPMAGLAGDLWVLRRPDAPGGILRLEVVADSLLLSLGADAGHPARASGTWEVGPAWVQALAFGIEADSVAVHARGSYEAGVFEARLDADAGLGAVLPLLPAAMRSGPEAPRGRLRLQAAAHGPVRDPLVHAELRLDEGAWRGADAGSVTARGTWTREALTVDSLVVDGGLGRVHAAGTWRAADGAVDGRLRLAALDVAPLWQALARAPSPVSGRISGDLEASGTVLDLDPAGTTLARLHTDLSWGQARWGALGLGDVRLDAEYEQPGLRARLSSAIGGLRVDGTVSSGTAHGLRWRLDDIDLSPLGAVLGLQPVTGRGSLSGRSTGSLRRPGIDLAADLRAVRAGGLSLGRLHLAGGVDSSGAFTASVTDGGEGVHLLAVGSWADRALHLANLTIAGVDVSPYLAGVEPGTWQGRIEASLDVQGDLARPEAEGRLRLAGLTLHGQSLGDVQLRVGVGAGRARVGLAALDSTVGLLGTVELEQEGLPFRLRGRVVEAQLQPFLALLTHQPQGYRGSLTATLDLRGQLLAPLDMDADVGLRQLRVTTPAGALGLVTPGEAILRKGRVTLAPLEFAGSAGRMRVHGTAGRAGPLDLHYGLDALGLEFLEPFLTTETLGLRGGLQGRLDIVGTAARPRIEGRIQVTGLGLLDLRLGNLGAAVSHAGSRLSLERLDLDLPGGGRLRGEAALPWRLPVMAATPPPGEASVPFAAQLRLDDVVLGAGQGLPDSVEVTLAGSLKAAGPQVRWRDLAASLDLERFQVRRGAFVLASERPLSLRLARGVLAAADTARFGLARGQRSGEPGVITVSGGASRAEGLRVDASSLDLEILARLAGSDRSVTGLVMGTALLRGTMDDPDLSVAWQVPAARIDSIPVGDMTGALHYGDGDLLLKRLDMTLAGGRFEARGHIGGDHGAPSAVGLLVDLADVELAPFRHWDAGLRGELESLSGRLSGLLEVSGTRQQPAYAGSLMVRDGRARLRGLDHTFAFAAATARLSGDSLHVDGLRDIDGRWHVSGRARLARRGLRDFDAAVRLEGLRLAVPDRVELTSSGGLVWSGRPDSSTITGHVLIESGRIAEPMSLRTLAFADSAGAAPVQADADTALLGVALDVDLEGRDLRLDNELAQLAFAADLRLSGTAARPVLDGELVAAEGLVHYMGHEFAVEHARFAFDHGRLLDHLFALFHDPARLDPGVDFGAHTEVKARNGNEYDIHLGLTGSFNELDVQLTSDPPEAEGDVLSLLRFGRTGVPMLDARGSMLNTKANLSPNYLLSMTESSFSRVLGLDAVEIDNSVLSPGRLSGSRIVLTKQLGKRTEMTYSTTVGYAAEGRVQLQYDLGHSVYVQTEHDAKGESGIDLNLKLRFR